MRVNGRLGVLNDGVKRMASHCIELGLAVEAVERVLDEIRGSGLRWLGPVLFWNDVREREWIVGESGSVMMLRMSRTVLSRGH